MNPLKCKKMVSDTSGWHSYQCLRNVWLDGYCKQHHPETIKARKDKSQAIWDAQWAIEAQKRERESRIAGVISDLKKQNVTAVSLLDLIRAELFEVKYEAALSHLAFVDELVK